MLDALALIFALYLYQLGHPPSIVTLPIKSDAINVIASIATLIYVIVSLAPSPRKLLTITKGSLLILIIAITTGLTTVDQMNQRKGAQPYEFIHDHPLQIELALEFLTQGKNPYTEDYKDTVLPKWSNWNNNPAIYHFVSLPSALYIALPFFTISKYTLGWFDHRIVTLLFVGVAIGAVWKLLKKYEHRALALILLGFNPLFSPHTIGGVEDITFLGMIFVALLLLDKRHTWLSLATLAVAVTTKHSAWFILPFYFYYLHQQGKPRVHILTKILIFILLTITLTIPFIIWDLSAAGSFIADIYAYPAGIIASSYPIKGFGIAPYLAEHGIVNTTLTYRPFAILQILILTPLLMLLLAIQKRRPTLSQVVLNYGILLWAFWFLSRFFNDTYLGVVTVIIGIGILMKREETVLKKSPHKK